MTELDAFNWLESMGGGVWFQPTGHDNVNRWEMCIYVPDLGWRLRPAPDMPTLLQRFTEEIQIVREEFDRSKARRRIVCELTSRSVRMRARQTSGSS